MIDFMKYSELVDVLNQWAKAYSDGHQEVSDDVYDKNYIMLKEFEAANPDFILDNSPTRHVSDGAEGFRKVKHEIPMISIANSNGIDEAVIWCTQMTNAGAGLLELEYKLDGLGLALKYRGGKLVDAITRGVDNVGDSVWENALRIAGVMHEIPVEEPCEIRGEVVWKYDDFNEYNESLFNAGKKMLSNPRNGAAGTLKSHDPEEVASRKLSFIAYLVVKGSDRDTQAEDIEWLEKTGFEVPPHSVVDLAHFRDAAEAMRAARFEQPYAIDGVVIKVNDKSRQAQFGYTTKTPNFYRAYKFPPEEKSTELLDIEQSIGMSGAITPVAIVKPVTLAMTTVQRCSLHNWDLVDYLGLHRGCHVTIRKAGEIIPEIVKCDETGMTKDEFEVQRKRDAVVPHGAIDGKSMYTRPTLCPYCGQQLRRAVNDSGEELVAWVCGNQDCQVQFLGKLVNFASRTVMNIRGFGESIAEELVDSGKVKRFSDIYRLTVDDLVGLGNYREKAAAKLIAAIDQSRGNYLHQLIEGLSIPGMGHQASPIAANVISTLGGLDALVALHDVYDRFIEECYNAGVSRIVSTRFADWAIGNAEEVMYFVNHGIAQQVKQFTARSNRMAGKVCIMTGVFDKLDRDVFKSMVEENGGTICSSITKKCNIVLMGEGAGPSKVAKIDQLKKSGQNITVYTPETLDQFMELFK